MNRIDQLFKNKKNNILSIYFTAGYPHLESTAEIIRCLSEAGVDMIEIGIPFSDPLADGPPIQKSNAIALRNGMNLKLLFEQLSEIRKEVKIPLLLMSYFNPVYQFGVGKFSMMAGKCGIDGLIIPDLPPEVYTKEYYSLFRKHDLCNVLLISPQSTSERIRFIDEISRGFIYMVSSSAVTGTKGNFSDEQIAYFERVKKMNLTNPVLTGFGISGRDTFLKAGMYSNGGIIGSEFIRLLAKDGNMKENIYGFIKEIR